jgi:pimeloyl-ACP methyl ester carboxylesterase
MNIYKMYIKHLRFFSVLYFCCIGILVGAQDQGVINHEARHFSLKSGEETIDFIKMDTSILDKKPVFLFCQGSLPMPLFVKSATYGTFIIGGGVTNFDRKEIEKNYHLIVVSMPHTPVIADEKNLNPSMCYVPDTAQAYGFDPEYIKADYLENYVRRAEVVLKFLKKQSWVNPSKLVVAGHSQGSKVAGKLAARNKKITHVGLFAANPFGRADQFVRQARKQAEKGAISWSEAEQKMQEQYDYFQLVHLPDSVAVHPEYRAWQSFSEIFLDDWLKIKAPIYLAYGTADITADLCDLVPLFFIQEGKKNLTYKRYHNLEHNFFEITREGQPDYNKGHWKEVMNAFIQWTLDTPLK